MKDQSEFFDMAQEMPNNLVLGLIIKEYFKYEQYAYFKNYILSKTG